MNSITINGHTYSGGRSISITNGKVIIDGNDVTPEGKEINITVHGDIHIIDVDVCNKVSVNGNAHEVKSASGDIDITGDVSGSVHSMSGNVECNEVKGSISTMSGNIKHRKI